MAMCSPPTTLYVTTGSWQTWAEAKYWKTSVEWNTY